MRARDAALPVIWVPGHLCGAWLYAPVTQGARPAPAPMLLADVTRDVRIEAMAERLLRAAPPRFLLAGLSMGGMVAMAAMRAAPGRVAGALLLSTDPTPARPKECAWRRGLLAAEGGAEGYVDAFAPRFFAHSDAVRAAHLPAVRDAMIAAAPAVLAAQAEALDHRRAMLPGLAGWPGPVEILVGAEDRICPPALHRPLAEALGSAALEILPETGHLATLEAPEAVRAALARLHARL